jgi:hypothetical protein
MLEPLDRNGSEGSRARLARARELTASEPPRTLDDCARVLADHDAAPQSLCVHEDGIEAEATVFGMACDLATGRMIVSDGRPCEGRWEELGVTAASAVAGRVG